ncbi:GntR family transcriptional regulator [Kineosporia babensis]|uniref:GntR family transcriptional regulator n=1 Tax=Kineosporia babensis TaxID=499548 RepID=A0A9X1NBE4_9ACTN|nr:GntR family transcriptional regulator [Kineosporia babensis]
MTSIRLLSTDEVPASLADQAYLALRDQLIMLQIQPGDPIDDVQVAKTLGVGRTPVREALKRLEGDRLVISYPRRGTFATNVDIADLAHVSEIRANLEPLAARRATERADAAVRAELTELADRTQQLDMVGTARTELMRWDLNVHRTIYRATFNPHLEDVLIRYDNLATRIHCVFLDRLTAMDMHTIAEHVALLRAMATGQADEAERLALEHVLGFERAVRAVI